MPERRSSQVPAPQASISPQQRAKDRGNLPSLLCSLYDPHACTPGWIHFFASPRHHAPSEALGHVFHFVPPERSQGSFSHLSGPVSVSKEQNIRPIPTAVPASRTSLYKTQPSSVANAGSAIASTAAFPASVPARPFVYSKNGNTQQITPIVLYSSFDTDASGDDGSLEPNTTYDDFQWILVRDNGGTWEVKTYGYG